MSEVIVINVVVGDRTYRLKVKNEDEEVVRKTVKMINDQIVYFKTNFAGKDMQDYIAMVIIWYATQTMLEKDSDVIASEHLDALAIINQQLTKALD